jgi:hypothetical protein
MRLSSALLAALLVALPLSNVYAQVQVDVSKITCEQYLLSRITDPRNIAIWLSGYYHGRSGKTMIETEAFKDNSEKLKNYCYSHMNSSVMSAVESLWKEVN